MVFVVMALSLPLFFVLFLFTWWTRGKGFEELIAPFRFRPKRTTPVDEGEAVEGSSSLNHRH